jgi:two-component system alkaline phosphatase synthesis response regulator PhoP
LTMGRLLVVEDDPAVLSLLQLSLEQAGHEVAMASTARTAAQRIEHEKFDLVILDLMLPDKEGGTLLPGLHARGIPVIVLTARDGLPDKIRALEGGADDYVTKPFEPLELLARVRAMLRRRGNGNRTMQVAGVLIDTEARTVRRDGIVVALTRKEFDLLVCLAEHRGLALSRDQLMQIVWGASYAGTTRTVDVHIQRLREKLSPDAIVTVTGFGYRLE